MDQTPRTAGPRDRRTGPARDALLDRIRAEFHEMPCLRLTRGQAQRLFGLPADAVERVLGSLVREGTLTCGADGRYSMRDAVVWPTPETRARASR